MKKKFLDTFEIAPTDRVLVCGQTGGGKSVLLRNLLQWRYSQGTFTIVMDPKAECWVDPANDQFIEDPKDLPKADTRYPVIYRPAPKHSTQKTYESVFEWIYRVKNCVVGIDEVYAVAPIMQSAHGYKALLTRGRSLGIATYSATQRPRNIPVELLSESQHRFIFNLDMMDDRRRIFDLTARKEFLANPSTRYGFRYHRSGMSENEPIEVYVLDAKKGRK